MNTTEKIRSKEHSIYKCLMAVLLPLAVILSLNFPINVDELLHYNHSKLVVDWYQTGGEDKAVFDTPWTNLKYYGQSVDSLTVLLNQWFRSGDEYLVRHITGAVFGWLLILFTSLIAREVSGRYRTAIVAALILILIPSIMGQYCNNLKDIPFATGYAYAVLFLIRIVKKLPRVPWEDMIHLTLAIAFLNSVRIGGLIIYPYLGLFVLIWLFINRDLKVFAPANRNLLTRFLLQSLMLLAGGYFLGLLFWPYAILDPLRHPFESLSLMEHYSISIRQIFRGEWYWSTALPANYLFIWLLISLPGLVMLGVLLYISAFFVKKMRISLGEILLLFAFLFPVFYVVVIDSNLYSAWRQMFFIAGPLSVIAAIGIERFFNMFETRKIAIGGLVIVLLVLSVFPLAHYFRNPDTSYVYFNSLAGRNQGAWSDYEYDYYWHGMKRATKWFDENIERDGSAIKVASNFDVSVYLGHRDDVNSEYVHYDDRSTIDWDYGIFGLNYIHPWQLKNDLWKPNGVLTTISDSKNPLVLVIKRANDNDFYGIRLAKAGKYEEAIPLLKNAVLAEPNNFKPAEYLAESYYMTGQTEECLNTLKQGKELHPWNERLGMIEAQILYDKGEYNNALEICLEIVNNNSKYYNIAPLLAACYEKTGEAEKAEMLRSKLHAQKAALQNDK